MGGGFPMFDVNAKIEEAVFGHMIVDGTRSYVVATPGGTGASPIRDFVLRQADNLLLREKLEATGYRVHATRNQPAPEGKAFTAVIEGPGQKFAAEHDYEYVAVCCAALKAYRAIP
jgi:hypothetical protein